MIDISRFRGAAVVAASILLAVGLLDLSLTAAVGFTGRFLPDQEEPNDDSVHKEKGGLISAVLSLPERPGIGTGTPLGVLLGSSTTKFGVDPRILEEKDGLPRRWLNLCGWGSSISRLKGIAELLYLSDLRPDVVVIGMNPYFLIGQHYRAERREAMRRTGNVIKPWVWVYDNRLMANHLFRLALHRVRLGLYRALGFDFSAIFPARGDPWGPERYEGMAPLRDSRACEQSRDLEHYRRIGWFDPDRYSPETLNSRALAELIQTCRARGAKVCIILVPEHSLLRGNTPSQAIRCLEEIIRANFPRDPVPVYDLRGRFPDESFINLIHPNPVPDVRNAISSLVAECLQDFLSEQPAPERFQAGAGGGLVGTASSSVTP